MITSSSGHLAAHRFSTSVSSLPPLTTAADPVYEHVVTIHPPVVEAAVSGPSLGARAVRPVLRAAAMPELPQLPQPEVLQARLEATERGLAQVRLDLTRLPAAPQPANRHWPLVQAGVSLLGIGSVGSLVTGACLIGVGQGRSDDAQAAGIGLLLEGVAGLACLFLAAARSDARAEAAVTATALREREAQLVLQRDGVIEEIRRAWTPLVRRTLTEEVNLPGELASLVLEFAGEPTRAAPAPAAV